MATLDNYGASNYVDYRSDKVYQNVSGLLVLPVADGEVVTSRVHAPYSLVTQTFGGAKKGTPPLLPTSEGERVLSYDLSLPLPIPGQAANGSGFTYAAAGRKVTVESTPSTPASSFAYPQWPFRLEPMATQAEQQSATTFNLQSSSPAWNQGFTLTSQFFSADI